ncbi:A disintegrin and metalloproteinase with thrombospondin motifs 7 isoform X1 [Cataglyphis hispanica]|uniref:A disintegrin and metalloproteinase with thrombospondin motifs 7 isoform X1 n=2 Tax=Cataglyphis hispanica TaxID=1086592 RepID=UPI00217FF4FA|nr:A disintegrin and metalloproteinase with thrombospondin motifs 7 isoform X1 [Cataglyphis hispanica]XP_050447702.1 A disintegrin and metalloproteinase with thrombospondin motifs 7 isoform X1 [Cataglyphis hispanica]XP_050447713.1 A disintegrin and metalloproteinase with thrombospondin motifs 7 isoform X1 [Cataglyphis hispanica]XP_050447722.1 A disintegrin and metalloproteinase with thrombospondin motifs 7 isoform X1 [Cataglyphis hispanica]
MPIMWYLLSMLQVLIIVGQSNLEARQRVPNVRGLYTLQQHLHDHEIVIPRKVNHLGNLISHNVTHHHHEDGPIVHYRVTVAGNEYHLELTATDNFIGRAMVVERRKRDLHVRSPAKSHGSKCHYRGFIKGHRNSRVALSACDGLAGMLHGDHGEFWLEPVAVSLEEKRGTSSTDEMTTDDLGAGARSSVCRGPTAPGGRPHLVFRRSAEQQQQQIEIGAGGRSRRRRKKKRKQERNCGTREPRRLTETRLEWQTQPGLVQVQGRGRRKHHQAKWHRSKRSISTPRHVEVLVVADMTMMAFHQDGDVETYLLTIMNMVSALYLDPTIGNFINIVVVRIILVEEEDTEQGLDIAINADRTLYNFCKWQQKLNPGDDSHPNHHDVAILVTREDICSRANTPCSTLGVAHVAGMCQPDRSCSVNEDNGITLAHTITHELGHNFGMYHDTEKIGCSKREGDTLHVMTPTFEVDAVGVAWSRCSRRDITNFLDQGKGDCLEDEPAGNDYAYPDLPPGAMYNAEHQCRLQFGVREASVCSPLHEICSKLWCIVDGSCTTMLHPAAPGTHCGKHMWCQNQECVPIVDRPRQIDGGWGEWGSWSECSRTCGAGVSIVERKCDHPEPAHGGKFCIGERRRYKICNTQSCPEGTPSFRAIQCSNYDGKEYKGKNYTWLPYFDQTEPCELYCTDTEESVIVPWGEAALDGTPCNVGTRDMCIAGICRKVGCDWMVDSDATEDRCGICHGDGTQCETTSGVYDKNDGPGYKEVIVIPSGSRNIKIEEIGNSKNYIGIGVPNSDKYFLNGKRQITLAGEYEVAGTPALYERDRDREKIRIPGPIKEDIAVYLIYRGHYRNFGLRYEYTVPKKKPDRAPEYSWVSSDWTLCTVTCGGGTQTSHAICREKKSGTVEDHFCDGIEKPEPKSRECNSNPCPARWWVGPWQMCPVTCGDSALRKRSVMCVFSGAGTDRSDLALPDRDCDKNIRPEEVEPCPDLPPCGPTSEIPLFVYADNKDMSFYNISLNEQDGITIVDSLTTEEPEILEFDNVVDENPDNSMYNTKSKWTVSKWSHCSNGKRNRKVTCSVPGDCNPDNKPTSIEDCYSGKWITGNWGSCNATCLIKSGIKYREVQCRDRATNLLSDDCNLFRRPFDIKRCYYRRQCTNDCKDSIAPSCANYKRMCDTSSIVREKCCATCMKRRRHVRHNRRHVFAK